MADKTTIPCPECSGKGSITCPVCRGQGRQQLPPVPHLGGDPETAQHQTRDAGSDLRERRLHGIAVGPPTGGRPHPAVP
jgi:hypothetical protein